MAQEPEDIVEDVIPAVVDGQPKPLDVGDEAQVKKDKKRKKDRDQDEKNNFATAMDTKQGRAAMWRILSEAGVFGQSFCGNNDYTNFNEGKRAVGIWLMEALFTSDKNLYNIMWSEARDRDEKGN